MIVEKVQYTLPVNSKEYVNNSPNWADFGISREKERYVGQGTGVIIGKGLNLSSDGFSKCSALIIKNVQTSQSALFHIDDWGLNYRQTPVVNQIVADFLNQLKLDKLERDKLLVLASAATDYWNIDFSSNKGYSLSQRRDFSGRMNELNNNKTLIACLALGDLSRDVGSIINKELLNYLAIPIVKEIRVETGQMHWGIVFEPENSRILIDSKKQKKVLEFSF